MRPSRVRAKLQKGEPVLVTSLHFIDPSLYELTSLLGFDAIWMDMEHHGYSLETAGNLMRAARVGSSDILCRPAKGEFMRMARMLEAGAQGIMYPRCEDAAEAAQVVRWAKFTPHGERGVDSGNADTPYCSMPLTDYLTEANQQTFVVIQLEQPSAVAQADKIAKVDGVDVLFLGPGDFSILAGIPGQFDHPKIQQALDQIAAAAKSAGKNWGCPAFSLEHAKTLLEMGARFITFSGDLLIMKRAFEQMQSDFAPLGFTFDNRLSQAAGRSI